MAANSIKPWRVLALRANVNLGTARLLLDCALDDAPPEPLAGRLRSILTELSSAQDLVRQITEVVP